MNILQQSQRKIDKTNVSFAKEYTQVDRKDEGPIEILKIIQNEYKIVSKLCVSAMFHVLIRINHHDHCDCDPSHQQNYWIFRFVSLKFLNDAQEKIK